jgi:hypothetical protein
MEVRFMNHTTKHQQALPAMRSDNTNSKGIRRIVRHGRKQFRIPENLDYYSQEDFAVAERKFIKTCVVLGKCNL